MNLYLNLDPYLAQWFVNEAGGMSPVKLQRGSAESEVLQLFLTTPPKDWVPDTNSPDAVEIIIPQFANKDTRYSFYLPPAAAKLLADLIRARFDICMWKELHKFSNLFLRQDNLIYAFMERHGIEPDERNFNAIAKRYQRKRDLYRKKNYRDRKKSEK